MNLILKICLWSFINYASCDTNKKVEDISNGKNIEAPIYTEEEFIDNIAVQSHFIMFYAPW